MREAVALEIKLATYRKSRLPSELMARLRDLPRKPKYFFPNMLTFAQGERQRRSDVEMELEKSGENDEQSYIYANTCSTASFRLDKTGSPGL